MAVRLADTARSVGIDRAGAELIVAAFRSAMVPRHERLDDDHDPAYLHPARTALILIEDARLRDPVVVAAGTLAESLRPELAAAGPAADLAHAAEIANLLGELPVPARDGDRLLERLVTAEEPVRLIALAERLDHVRHLHLRPSAEWAALHAETCAVYRPVAERTDPTLARRFRWWCGMFERRFLHDGHAPQRQ